MKSLGRARPATAVDMKIIEAWLPKDRSIDTLASNWHITLAKFSKGEVLVWEEVASGMPLAYCWGSLNSRNSILEVQPAYRGRGIGRALADLMLADSLANAEPLLQIQIAPINSVPFWQAMGFETYWEGQSCYGRRMLELGRDVPPGVRHPVVVSFLPEQAAWMPDSKPLVVHELEGVEPTGESRIVLPKTVAHFDLTRGDLVVEVIVCGKPRYRDKAKYEGAAAIGVQHCKNGFMVSEILTGLDR